MSSVSVRPVSFRFIGSLIITATLAFTAAPAFAQTFMSEDQLLATIPGSTIDGKSKDGTRWAQAYSAYDGKTKKGAIAGKFGGKDYKAKWYVENGQWCENWGDGQGCWHMEQVAPKKLRTYLEGKPRPNLWVIR